MTTTTVIDCWSITITSTIMIYCRSIAITITTLSN
jgi:hypothetical protein